MFETVYTCPDWWDGPRGGIADYLGRPHRFESEWDYYQGEPDTFLLTPIDAETFRLALEDWTIWRRWESAFYQGQATQDTHPVLPEDRTRYEELQRLLDGRLIVDASCAFRKVGEFRARQDPSWSGFGMRPLEVQWSDIH